MATTALARQLQLLSAATSNNPPASSASYFLSKKNQNTKPSILFDPHEAADIDSSTLFSLALSGLEELIAENSHFTSFQNSLLSVGSSQTDREQQGKEFNEKLDSSIHNFMSLVTDYLLLSPAHQVLEYLIRRYSIHIYNVDDLITFTLPYHETVLFVRIVQLANIENTRWHFLSGVKNSGAPPPRELLVQQCLRDMAVLDGICESGHILKPGKVSRSKTAYSFSAIVVMEVLVAARSVSSTLLNRILPFIAKCFENDSPEEYEIGGLMIIGTLASKANLSEETSVSLIDLISRIFYNEVRQVEDGKVLEMGVMVIVQIIQTQPLSSFPKKALKIIAKIRQLPQILKRISTSFKYEKALTLLIKGIITHCLSSPRYRDLLQDLIHTLPLQDHAESMILNFLEMCNSQGTIADNSKDELKKLLLDMESIFPKELDKSVNKLLESRVEEKPLTASFLSLLSESLDGTLHEVLPSTNQSIYMSLKHPEAKFRGMALQEVANVARKNPEMKVVCSEALLLGLHDDDFSVVSTVLSIDGLEEMVNAEELLTSVVNVLMRCNELFDKGIRSMKVQANSIVRICLQLLSSSYLNVNPSYVQNVGHVFLSYMFLYPKTWKLNLAALKLSKNVKWNFFRGLKSVENDLLDAEVFDDKEARRLRLHYINTKVVESLANGLWEDLDSLPLEFASITNNHEGAKCFILLVLLKTLSRGSEGLSLDLAKKYFSFLKQEWISIESSDEFPASKINDVDILGDSTLSYDFFKIMQGESKLAFGCLVVASLYRVLSSMPLIQKPWLNLMEDLFVVFSSPPSRSIFEKHIKLVLEKIPISPLQFLSSFFNAEGSTVPVSAQLHSLYVLSWYWDNTKDVTWLDIQNAVPHLVTALSCPIKAVREEACGCLANIYTHSKDISSLSYLSNDSEVENDILNVDTLHTFLEMLLEHRSWFAADSGFISKFLLSSLGSLKEHSNMEAEKETVLRLKKSARAAVFVFHLQSAAKFPLYAQYSLFVNLKGVGYMREQVVETKKIFESLLAKWNKWKFHGSDEDKLSKLEIHLFQHLLQIHLHHEGMHSLPNARKSGSSIWLQTLMAVLNIGEMGGHIDSDEVEILCVALSCLNNKTFNMLDSTSQDVILKKLIVLSRLNPKPVQIGSQIALQKIQMRPQVIKRNLNDFVGFLHGSANGQGVLDMGTIESLITLTEFLLSEHGIAGMDELVSALFDLLRKLPKTMSVEVEGSKDMEVCHLNYLQNLVLGLLENIAKSTDVKAQDAVYDVDFLVEFIHGTTDISIVNQAISLLTTVAGSCPDIVLQHVLTVFSILGEMTLVQDNSHSYIVTEKLISAVVPSWLQKFEDPRLLLEIMVKALPDVPSHRRIPLLKTTLRFMQESTSLHILLLLLIENSVSSLTNHEKDKKKRFRDSIIKPTDLDVQNWAVELSNSICDEYEIPIRFSGLLKLLKCSGDGLFKKKLTNENAIVIHDRVVNFVSDELAKVTQRQNLQSEENQGTLKGVFTDMWEILLSHLQRLSISTAVKKVSTCLQSLQDSLEHLLQCVTNQLSISAFTGGIVHVLQGSDAKMKMRALCLISVKLSSSITTLKGKDSIGAKSGRKLSDDDSIETYGQLVKSIVCCLDENENLLDVVLSALSALKSCTHILANKTPDVFLSSIPILVKNVLQNYTIAPACLQCIASIILETGPSFLPVLNDVIIAVLEISKKNDVAKEADLFVAILGVFEAIVEKLGGFLSPYLDEILDFLLLRQSSSESTSKMTEKFESVQKSLPKMIPVRHLINPLISAYSRCLQKGEASLLACIKMLSLMVSLFDKTSVAAYYTKVFELCLAGFDIRRNPPLSLSTIVDVETSIISLFSGLVMKLNEKTFKPLFVRILEWAETEVGDGENGNNRSVHRRIVFYRVVYQLTEKLRSVFVPYFQYFLNGSVQLLASGQESPSSKPRKKSKVLSESVQSNKNKSQSVTGNVWHLRYLIVSALHKCFLYDNVGFLETEKFQMLLGPLVEQINVEKPLNTNESIPSSQDMDQALVVCLGQMAITAGTDLLWKPLNHEVLLCSRLESVRVRMLSLEIVKFLVEHLREDYLALLPETIPFLAELLEDSDLSVVAKSQEIIKLLEELSGESLSQYL